MRTSDNPTTFTKAADFRALAKVMRRCRLALGITQREISGYCNVTQSTISRIEQGKRYPSVVLIRRIAEFLEIDCHQLLIITALSALDHPDVKEQYLVDIMQALKKDQSTK